jgi:hypothetical protein
VPWRSSPRSLVTSIPPIRWVTTSAGHGGRWPGVSPPGGVHEVRDGADELVGRRHVGSVVDVGERVSLDAAHRAGEFDHDAALPAGEPKQGSIWHPPSRLGGSALADVCRPMSNLWQLDRRTLMVAVKTYAADVPVIDLW